MEETSVKYVIEAALLAAGEPLSVDQLLALFDEQSRPERKEIRAALEDLTADYEPRGIMLAEVASGFRIQIRPSMTTVLQPLWEQRAPRYSRALFETLALVAYRQPITRGEIEEVRGVAVSPNIVRTLLDREWIRVVGHRDVPGKPEMFGTTKGFLDYFGLKSLDDLPPLAELQDIEGLSIQLDLPTEEGAEEVSPASVTTLPAAGEAEGATVSLTGTAAAEQGDEGAEVTEEATGQESASVGGPQRS